MTYGSAGCTLGRTKDSARLEIREPRDLGRETVIRRAVDGSYVGQHDRGRNSIHSNISCLREQHKGYERTSVGLRRQPFAGGK